MSVSKKRKISDESRVFQEKWSNSYFFKLLNLLICNFKCTYLILRIVKIKLNFYIYYMFLLRMRPARFKKNNMWPAA
jgi:hypothetical protein